jgi:hydroxymethylglutaryl-CoA reductase
MATAFFKIPVEKLAWKDLGGKEVAAGIMSAFEFAMNDIARATTHNKGIMNGIDAVSIALGQDWRAIESASHAFASLDNGYKPLTKYRIVKDSIGKEHLIGKLELPLS